MVHATRQIRLVQKEGPVLKVKVGKVRGKESAIRETVVDYKALFDQLLTDPGNVIRSNRRLNAMQEALLCRIWHRRGRRRSSNGSG